MDKIIMIGGKGSAVVIAEQIYDTQVKAGNVEFLGYAFDDESFGGEINGFPVLCKTYEAYKKYAKYGDVKFLYQIYRPDLMEERIQLLKSYQIPHCKFATFIHHSAYVANSVVLGHGNVILSNVIINSNAVIGNFNTIHSYSLIGHDTVLEDYNFVAAHNVIGSNSRIGNGNFFGINSSVNNYITMGNYNFLGMASNLIKSLDSQNKVYGNPARNFERKIKPL